MVLESVHTHTGSVGHQGLGHVGCLFPRTQGPDLVKRLRERSVGPWVLSLVHIFRSSRMGSRSRRAKQAPSGKEKWDGGGSKVGVGGCSWGLARWKTGSGWQDVWLCCPTKCTGARIPGVSDPGLRKTGSSHGLGALTDRGVSSQHLMQRKLAGTPTPSRIELGRTLWAQVHLRPPRSLHWLSPPRPHSSQWFLRLFLEVAALTLVSLARPSFSTTDRTAAPRPESDASCFCAARPLL